MDLFQPFYLAKGTLLCSSVAQCADHSLEDGEWLSPGASGGDGFIAENSSISLFQRPKWINVTDCTCRNGKARLETNYYMCILRRGDKQQRYPAKPGSTTSQCC